MGNYLYVDSREPPELIQEIKRAVGEDRVMVGLFQTADFALFDICGCSIGIERKSVSDFLGSFGTGRMMKQLTRLRQAYSPILLMEGWYGLTNDLKLVIGRHETGWHHASVQMMQFALQSQGVRMLWTPNHQGTADLLRILLSRSERKCLREHVSWDDLYDTRGLTDGPAGVWVEPVPADASPVLQPRQHPQDGAGQPAGGAQCSTVAERPTCTTRPARVPRKPRGGGKTKA